jgi:signal transduction histidine kinase
MVGLRRALLVLVAVGVAFAAADVALVLASDHETDKLTTAILGPIIGLSFIGTGAFAWWRRPHNRFGLLMTTVGFAWFAAGLSESNSELLFTIGTYLGPLYVAVVVHMMLAFPAGRLETVAQRATVAAAYLDVLLVRLPYFLLGGDLATGEGAPRLGNAFAIVDEPDVAAVFNYTAGFVGVVVLVATLVLMLRKRQASTAPQRRAHAPMLVTGLAVIGLLGLSLLLEVLGVPDGVARAATLAAMVAFAILPLAFLAGLVRSRYSRAGAVGALIERLNAPEEPGSLREALADALGDRSLMLVYWRSSVGGYVTFDGRPVELPVPGSDRAVTEVVAPRSPIEGSGAGRRIGAIIHDASLQEDEAALVRAVAASTALALDNERLEAELRARVAELQSSRTRLLEVSMFERRRLERDLHDGAQQRLVALSLQLGMAQRRLQDADAESADTLLGAARDELGRALEELRELARGIHPAVLTDRGLGPALESLAERAPLPVDLTEMPADRLPPPVEAAAYFVVAEALTNVVKYADAHHASVRVSRDDSYAVVEVRDDGVGGADPATGTGLRGLADRVAALDGRLEVDSPTGRGTTVRAEIPCA